jgi:hypothetical protein
MSYEDYLAANWLRVRTNWSFRRSMRFVAVIALPYAAIVSFGEIADKGVTLQTILTCLLMGLLVGVCAMVGIRIWLLWCLPRSARLLYKQNPSASAPYDFTFDANGMQAVGPFETSNLPWSHFVGWLENDRLIMLSKTATTFFCLPKTQLGPANEAELKRQLDDAGVKKGL